MGEGVVYRSTYICQRSVVALLRCFELKRKLACREMTLLIAKLVWATHRESLWLPIEWRK